MVDKIYNSARLAEKYERKARSTKSKPAQKRFANLARKFRRVSEWVSFIFPPFRYISGITPKGYKCNDCGITGVKLWREYNTFLDHQILRCFECACKNQNKEPEAVFGDQISWLVPAVPTEDGTTYWGYTSVPQSGCDWWSNLRCVYTYHNETHTWSKI